MKYIIPVLFFITIAIFSCDNSISNTTKIQVYLQGNAYAKKSIQGRSLDENINTIDISAYIGSPDADGSLVIKQSYDSTVQIATLEIQSGHGRIILVEALNAVGDILYRGLSNTLDLQPGKTEDIEITMTMVNPPEDKTYEITLLNNFDYNLVVGGILYVSTFQADASIFDGDIKDIYITCDNIKASQIGLISPTSSSINVNTSSNTYNFIVLWGLNADGNISYAGATIISGNNPPAGLEIHSCTGDWDEDPNTPDSLHENCICSTN